MFPGSQEGTLHALQFFLPLQLCVLQDGTCECMCSHTLGMTFSSCGGRGIWNFTRLTQNEYLRWSEFEQGAGYRLVPTSPRERPLSWKNSSVLFSSLLYIISTCSRG